MNICDQKVIDAPQFNNLPELEKYFNTFPLTKIKFDAICSRKIMMDSGYTHNLTTRFWRALKTAELIEIHKTNIHMSTFLLEVFTNQCLSFTDILATWINHFLNLKLKGQNLSIHRKKFIEKFKNTLLDKTQSKKIDKYYNWSHSKLYSLRNILHHMGEVSGIVNITVSRDLKWNIEHVCVPKEDEWDFAALRKELAEYPSQTAYQIATNQINHVNILTGDPGDSHKYENIVDFTAKWIDKIYDIATLFVGVSVAQLKELG